ncbi:unnamed protein product [Prunus armeniaca]|uniref:CCHC-type domain-containing protein n=1 Tax=Prunus armeniaca TaxID=36596 RepID=A0A6J5TSV3_PRUAR|nr:unnamed protein product [Prunus armeniaca]
MRAPSPKCEKPNQKDKTEDNKLHHIQDYQPPKKHEVHLDFMTLKVYPDSLTFDNMLRDIYQGQPPNRETLMEIFQIYILSSLKMFGWHSAWTNYCNQENDHCIFPWRPHRLKSASQPQTNLRKQILAVCYSVTLLTLYIPETNFRNPSQWAKMDNAKTEDLVIKLEESLGFSSLESGPKLIGAIIADKRWPSNLAIEEAPTHMVAYWIQAHGIPLNLMSTGNAMEIGEKLGTVLEVEDPWNKGPRGFLRIHTLIDTTNPLAVGFWLPRPEGLDTWAKLKYEKLSNFCFDCGRLGHTKNGCKFNMDKNEDGESAAFGDWMKARAVHERRNQVSLNVPIGVRRRAGQICVMNSGTRAARVAQRSGENEIVAGNNNGSWHTDQSTPRAEQWSQSEGTKSLMLGRQTTSSPLSYKTDGNMQKRDGNG